MISHYLNSDAGSTPQLIMCKWWNIELGVRHSLAVFIASFTAF